MYLLKLFFFSNRSLYCSRTKIHINLLLAIFIQIIARMVNYGFEIFVLKFLKSNILF